MPYQILQGAGGAVQEGSSLHLSYLCFGKLLPGLGKLGIQFRAGDNLLVEGGNIVLMVFWIMVTVPFDNIYEEQIYSFLVIISLAFLTLFIIVLVAAASTTVLNFLLGSGWHTLFTYSWPGSRPGSSVWNGLHYMVLRPPFSTASLSDVDCTVNFARETLQGVRRGGRVCQQISQVWIKRGGRAEGQ